MNIVVLSLLLEAKPSPIPFLLPFVCLSQQCRVPAEDLKPGYGSQAPHAHPHTSTSAGFGQDCQRKDPVQRPLELGLFDFACCVGQVT